MEELKYPVGKFSFNPNYAEIDLQNAINYLAKFPVLLIDRLAEYNESKGKQRYRPEGWSLSQVVHHVADSHMNALTRFKWTLTETEPAIKAYHEHLWSQLNDGTNPDITPSLDIITGLHKRMYNLISTLSKEEWKKKFYHPEMETWITLDKLCFLYEWHSKHHLAHVNLALTNPY